MGVSTKKIQNRIKATKKTSQITNAMNMVSSSKLKKIERTIHNYLKFVEGVEDIISNLLRSEDDVYHPLLETQNSQKVCYLLITSDRGLAGPFNNNLFKSFEEAIKIHQSKEEYIVGAFGTKGFSYVRKRKHPTFTKDAVLLRDDVRYMDIRHTITNVIEMYLSGKIGKVVIIYNHFVNTLSQVVTKKQLLPLEKKFKETKKTERIHYIYEGGADKILSTVLPLYIESLVYGLVLDSKASEHASRMTAMKNATDNAYEIIGKLELLYNRARQAAITSELTDIIGGASAAVK